MAPNPLPGLYSQQTGPSAQIKPSKRKTLADSTTVNTNHNRPKPDEITSKKPASDQSGLAAVTEDMETVISGITERLGAMKLILGRGDFSAVEELAKRAPEFLEGLRAFDRAQKNEIRDVMQKRREMEREAAEQKKMVKSLRAQLAESEATESLHATALESLLRDVNGSVAFRAMLNDEEVTVGFTVITKSQEAVVTVHCTDRRKLSWHDKLEKCVVSIENWDWFLCLGQGSGKPGMHVWRLMEQDVAQLPTSLRRDTERGVCYCREPNV